MQGSQRKRVIYFLYKNTKFVTRQMTYTAITRAENSVLLLGERKWFNESVNNISRPKKEFLYWRLRAVLPQDYIPDKDERMKVELRKKQALMNEAAAAECGSDDGGDEDYSE